MATPTELVVRVVVEQRAKPTYSDDRVRKSNVGLIRARATLRGTLPVIWANDHLPHQRFAPGHALAAGCCWPASQKFCFDAHKTTLTSDSLLDESEAKRSWTCADSTPHQRWPTTILPRPRSPRTSIATRLPARQPTMELATSTRRRPSAMR